MRGKTTSIGIAVGLATLGLVSTGAPVLASAADGDVNVGISLGSGVSGTDALEGRVYFLVAPRGNDPLWDVSTGGSTMIFGKNVAGVESGDVMTLDSSPGQDADSGVYGFWRDSRELDSLDDIPAGDYTVRAFFNKYETVTRSDGSTVSVHFPCGDGGSIWNSPGNLLSDTADITIGSGSTDVALTLDEERPRSDDGPEIGGCSQGNYTDTDRIKYVKIRSTALSDFWGRDMYVGASIVLPANYDPADESKRYPVIYDQDHWAGYNTSDFLDDMFTVKIRQESPFYDSAYGVNSANNGPWGDAINDELVPEIDRLFNTIAEPWARAQQGGSTGGWVSLANTMFRPDLYGSSWSYYPDPLDFHRHQLVDVYDGSNAYWNADGSEVGSWRNWAGWVTMPQENHYELALGTNSRSFDQWDIWNAVYGPQGYNGYPLDPWNKVTGKIDNAAGELWKGMDLTNYIGEHWSGDRNLSEALKDRLHVSVGTEDEYYLDGGVSLFKQKVEELGGSDWATVDVVPGGHHTGRYDYKSFDDHYNTIRSWMADHAPDGATPLSQQAVGSAARGNTFEEVLATGGRAAAVARQADPALEAPDTVKAGTQLTASFGSWDSAVALTGQWTRGGTPLGDPIAGVQGDEATYTVGESDLGQEIAFTVTGAKPGYTTETRVSVSVAVPGAPVTPTPAPTDTPVPTAPPVVTPTPSVGAGSGSGGGDTHKAGLAATGLSSAPLLLAGAVGALLIATGAVVTQRRRRNSND